MDEAKRLIRCHECGTNFSVRLSKIPKTVKSITCISCQAEIPLFERMVPDHAGARAMEALDENAVPLIAAAARFGHGSRILVSADGEEDDDGAWLAIYGDMMSLLLVFFILLFAISTIDKHKFEVAMGAISGALGGGLYQDMIADTQQDAAEVLSLPEPEPPPASPLTELRERMRTEQKELRELRVRLEYFIVDSGLDDRFELSEDNDGLIVVARDAAMFDAGSSTLKDEFKPPLRELADILSAISNDIVIEGHTDDKPISTDRFRSNWELSAERATTVVRFFLDEMGFDPDRISAAGYAYFHPRFPFYSADADKNRRIEILVKRKYASDVMQEVLDTQ